MSTITLTATDGEIITRPVPRGWGEVPLLPYAKLAQAWDSGLVARIDALAGLLDIPAQPLLDDVAAYGQLLNIMPWLATLPAGEPVTEFKHQGTTYVCAGHLRTLTAGQLEAIYTMQHAFEGRPLEAAPGILAVLFVPKGKTLTAELHQASTAAFASLPVSVAWPLLTDFIANGASAVLPIASYSALHAQLSGALDSLETALRTSSVSSLSLRRPLRFLLRHWIKSVRAMATKS